MEVWCNIISAFRYVQDTGDADALRRVKVANNVIEKLIMIK